MSFTRNRKHHEAQSYTVQQHCHDPCDTVKRGKQGLHFGARQHDRQQLTPLGSDNVVEPARPTAEDLLIQELAGAERRAAGSGSRLR
jgi:hypothetical protein